MLATYCLLATSSFIAFAFPHQLPEVGGAVAFAKSIACFTITSCASATLQ